GLVHYHFQSKLQVLLALIEAMEARIAQRVEHALSGATDAWGRVDALLHGLLALGDGGDEAAAACWAQIGAEAQRIPEVGAAYRDGLARWRAHLIEALTAAGAPDPIGLALLAVIAAEGAWRVGHGAPSLIPPGEALPMVRGLVRRLGGAP
ncbi:MAG: TetR family transcriptional regulator C-terminal domain-containing protein, partial [Myxococcales bacterium]|nr:TetR family transcriptional regulator C-terminal domain-containing protein [Myxococcales bacterium]